MSAEAKIRAAKLRLAITDLLGDNKSRTQEQIADELPLSLMGTTTVGAFYQLLRHMDNNGLIKRSKESSRNLYSLPGQAEAPSGAKAADAAVPAKEKKTKASNTAHMTIDIIKSTGRVRLQLQGMVIEIGIQET
jgi:hypothetical protein